MSSIFSKIIAGEIPCYKIVETDNFLAFLDGANRIKYIESHFSNLI